MSPLLILFVAFGGPLIPAVFFGLRAGRADPQSVRDFAWGGAGALAWAGLAIFTWHALWISSLVPAEWEDTLRSAVHWSVVTAALWLPCLGITYVLRAMKARRGG